MATRHLVVGALLAVSMLGGVTEALEPAARREVEAVVREYLLENPEIVLEAVRTLRARQDAAAQERTRQAVAAKRDTLLLDPGSPVTGDPAGDVTVVEFFDYRCG
jgi:protein-disulfide isomerase